MIVRYTRLATQIEARLSCRRDVRQPTMILRSPWQECFLTRRALRSIAQSKSSGAKSGTKKSIGARPYNQEMIGKNERCEALLRIRTDPRQNIFHCCRRLSLSAIYHPAPHRNQWCVAQSIAVVKLAIDPSLHNLKHFSPHDKRSLQR